ncbi:hypothetical protein VP01_4425g1 [Puccinia sorghi]|uniref:Uncharacterized protein n=1 Tax=Puccinia sorghi TaxID=27349 RepID=A0A0L6URI2_9BASI|nr:hypothetical protein VP01_4425g1 [Puccinia sorghi]
MASIDLLLETWNPSSYCTVETQINLDYEWLFFTKNSFKSTVAPWEPDGITILADCTYTSISPDHKLYKRWLDATNWFAAKTMQIHTSEQAQTRGIPSTEVPKILKIWIVRRQELGLGEFSSAFVICFN